MNATVTVPQDYRVTLNITVDNQTLLLAGLLILGAVAYAKAKR